MEKLPTIILPTGSDDDITLASPRTGGSTFGPWEQPKTPTNTSPLRLGGIRLRCPRPQQLVEDFYVKRLGMQELALISSPPTRSGVAADALDFRIVLPQRQQFHQLLQHASVRTQQRHTSASSSRLDLGSALGEELPGSKNFLKEQEAYSKAGSRGTSFGSQYPSRSSVIGSFASSARFVAFEFFSTAEVEVAVTEACEPGEASTPFTRVHKNWLKHAGQFVLECVPVQKVQGLYKPYEHHRSDVFSRIAFCVSDVDASAVCLSQHMIRVHPAGQFLDMAYAANFLDPHNFRGRLVQYMSEYKMVSRKALPPSESKRLHSSTSDSANNLLTGENDKRPESESSETPGAPSEGGSRQIYSPLSSPFSSTSSSALSVVQAEREGCLPTPTVDDLKAVESQEASTPNMLIRFDTLPLEKLPVLHHIELRATAVEHTLCFYEEVLGMTLIEKKTSHGCGFILYYLSFDPPTHTSYRYWLWLQRFSCICIKAVEDGSKVEQYHDLEPAECGFLGISFLCSPADEERLLKRFQSKKIDVSYVEDEVYGRKVMLLRDPQNVPIRIVVTS